MKPGDLIAGRYQLLRPIGRGAMGTVWAARHELLGRDFALKFARVATQADPAARARFQREAQIVGKLRHPNIVDVTDFGEVSPDGDFFLAMELLDGESLAERIATRGHLESFDSVSIATDIARGLAAVHGVGIVHRDVKPENIFLARNATGNVVPKLLDFGISKESGDPLMTQQGILTGTPAYMSPEQANGETQLDPRTDIWSVGVVLYEMLTGKHPFVEQNYQALMTAIAERPYVPLDPTIPSAVCRIVDRCLTKRPADRFSSCDELAEALQGVGLVASQQASGARRQSRRSMGLVVFGLALGSCLLAALGWWLRASGEEPVPQPLLAKSVTVEPLALASVPATTVPAAVPAPLASTTSTPATQPPLLTPQTTTTRSSRPLRDKRTSTSVTQPGF